MSEKVYLSKAFKEEPKKKRRKEKKNKGDRNISFSAISLLILSFPIAIFGSAYAILIQDTFTLITSLGASVFLIVFSIIIQKLNDINSNLEKIKKNLDN